MDMANTTGQKIEHNIKYLKTCIKDIGKKEKDKDLVPFFTQTVIDLKVIFLKI